VFVARVIAKLEPGGAQLSMLRVMRELRGHGIASVLHCGWATPAGIELARRHGAEREIWGEGGNLQWVPDPRFAAWLGEGSPPPTSSTRTCSAPGGRPRAPLPRASRWSPASTTSTSGPAGRAAPSCARRSLASTSFRPRAQRPRHGDRARPSARANARGHLPVVGTRARAAPGLPSPRIVFAGRLDPDKGPDILVEALGLLRDPPTTLILGDGRLRANLQRRVRELGLAKRVSFPGWVADPGPYIAGATVLAIPSRDEAFSQTAIIGLAHGVPVIGTEVDGFPATLGIGRGILVAPEDPQALAAALERVLHDELPRPRPLRSLAERHAPARVAAIYERTYRGLVAPRAAGAQAVS
jgi:glycosyltransferase involved in cell wall biosynthesis